MGRPPERRPPPDGRVQGRIPHEPRDHPGPAASQDGDPPERLPVDQWGVDSGGALQVSVRGGGEGGGGR